MKTLPAPWSRGFSPRIESLESRIAPAPLVLPSAGQVVFSADHQTAMFLDVDGDLVTVKNDKEAFQTGNFTLALKGLGAQLQLLDIHSDPLFAGAKITFSAKPVDVNGDTKLDGDGFVNVGAIDATGRDLGGVTIRGDLGQIDAGSGSATSPALGSLTVGSLGRFDLSTQAVATASLTSNINGALGKLVVKTDVIGASVKVTGGANGTIGSVAIGRSLFGGATADSGLISADGAVGAVTIGGSVIGGAGPGSGKLGFGSVTSVKIGGSLLGGAGEGSGLLSGVALGVITIAHDVQGAAKGSGAIVAFGGVGSVAIGGNLVGGKVSGGSGDLAGSIVGVLGPIGDVKIGGTLDAGANGGGIRAGGTLGAVKIGGDVRGSGSTAIISSGGDSKGLTVAGSVRSLLVSAGSSPLNAGVFLSDVQLGPIVVKGDWIASSAVAGINPGADGKYGTVDDSVGAGTDPAKFARIVGVTIGGEARGTDGGTDSFAITAETIGAVKFGKGALKFTDNFDDLFFGPTFDLRARELDPITPAAPATPTPFSSDPLHATALNVVIFTDVDGDTVTITTDKGKFFGPDFDTVGGPFGGLILRGINLQNDADFVGKNASITIVAKPTNGHGDGFVDIGYLNADGVDLAKVRIAGDVGQFDAGSGVGAKAGVGTLAVHSLGGRGVATQAGGSNHNDIAGNLGKLEIGTNLDGAPFGVDGRISSVTIRGSIVGDGAGRVAELVSSGGDIGKVIVGVDLVGGSVVHSGRIRAAGSIGSVTVAGSIFGGTAEDAGSIEASAGTLATAKIGRSVIGGSDENSGTIYGHALKSVTIGGDLAGGSGLHSGSVHTGGPPSDGATIGAVKIGGSLFGGTGTLNGILSDSTIGDVKIAGDLIGAAAASVKITAQGILTPADAKKALAIKSLKIGGTVHHADILAGYDKTATAVNADVQIGKVEVKGDWVESNLVAGIVANAGGFGDGDDAAYLNGEKPEITALIASITIGGQALGEVTAAAPGDNYAFTAQEIGSCKIGTVKLPLAKGLPKDDLPIGTTGDVRVRELA